MGAFFALHRSGKDIAAGAVLGFAAAIRFHPGFVILYLAWRRELRPVLAALAAAGAVTGLALLVFGWDQSYVYFTQVAAKNSTALISVENHSVAGFLATVGRALGWVKATEQTSSSLVVSVGSILSFRLCLLCSASLAQ